MADIRRSARSIAPIAWEVERGKIREMARAIGDPNPIYLDREAAIKEGYRDTPAPPTFLTVPMMWCASMPVMINDLKINFFMVLHGEEEYEYYREIYPGDIDHRHPEGRQHRGEDEQVGQRKWTWSPSRSSIKTRTGKRSQKPGRLLVERK